nr:MAG TPA: hypothetical protein [Caudoviricetes sp.]DAT31996.1 MAG TPA: hypothetical protein [Caudoviricetes sp.]
MQPFKPPVILIQDYDIKTVAICNIFLYNFYISKQSGLLDFQNTKNGD